MAYELMVIVSSGGSDAILGRLENALRDSKAADIKVTKLGKKALAYPIKKQTEGEYVVFNFESDGAILNDLHELLRLEQEAILRYLVLKTKPVKKSKGAKGTKVSEAIQEQKELKPTAKVTVRTKTEVSKVSPASEKATAGKKVAKGAGVTKEKESVKKKGNN